MKMSKSMIIVALASLGAGCTNLALPISTTQDQFAKQNFAAQVVDPEPAEGAPQADAEMVDAAVDRYRNDEIKSVASEAREQSVTLGFAPEGGGN